MSTAMRHRKRRGPLALVALVLGLVVLASASCTVAPAPQAPGGGHGPRDVPVRFSWLQGYDDPDTPDELDRVGVLRVGSARARNVLVLNPGTSAGAGYFVPLAKDIVRQTRGQWQVWSVERRENQLEDHSMLDRAKRGEATSQQLFDYYLGWVTDPAVTEHIELIPDDEVAYARGWGLEVEIEDLRRVVRAAGRGGRRVVMGGHSLGGSITTAYATWDFDGRAGADDLDGLVYIDGGSNPEPVTPEQATASLASLEAGTPWLSFGGIPTPYLGLFSSGGSFLALSDPDSPSIGQDFPLLPAEIRAPVPATNEAQFGYGVDTETSPPNLWAAQVHAGRLAESGEPRGWDPAGEITPLERYATMLSGYGIEGHDGNAWYHPQRLTIDAGAVAAGNANPAQDILGVRATHGHDLDPDLRIYAFGATGGEAIVATAQVLADQSGIPAENVTLVDRGGTYAHNDPAAASPDNDFLENLTPYLRTVARSRR